MQLWTNTCSLSQTNPIISCILQAGDLLIDIETTGLSRARHQIYLIGMVFVLDCNSIYVNQYFADNPADEPQLLKTFSNELQSTPVKRIITFNGNTFDFPFLVSRAKKHGIMLDFSMYKLLDIYKEITKRKHLFQLKNYRQKTIEQFLGIQREDQYSGGELIAVYEKNICCPNEAAVNLLKLHNYEDLLGMIDLLSIFSYDAFLSSPACVCHTQITCYTNLDGTPGEELIATLLPTYPLPGQLSCEHPISHVYLHVSNNTVRIRVPLDCGVARLYYSDYKNYYYLPVEDMAIHKSVATYVDDAHRQKATPETCYTKVNVTQEFLQSEQVSKYFSYVIDSFRYL